MGLKCYMKEHRGKGQVAGSMLEVQSRSARAFRKGEGIGRFRRALEQWNSSVVLREAGGSWEREQR
jgi:hypothetical protein